MGRRINGRFDSFKAACKRVVRFIVRWSLISAAAYALFMGGAMFYSTSTVSASFPEIKEVDHTPEKIASLKAGVVSTIMACESAGHKEEDGLLIFDTNNRASVGRAQFQIATVQQYEKSLYGKDITRKDAILLSLNDEEAAALANDIIFKADGLGNWLNCANKYNLRPRVDAIKFLEK